MSEIGMKQSHREILRRLKPHIAERLDAVCAIEFMSEIFSIEEEQHINHPMLIKIDKARRFIDILLRKGPTAFPRFVEFCDMQYPDIARQLREQSGMPLTSTAQVAMTTTGMVPSTATQQIVVEAAIKFIHKEITVAQCVAVGRDLHLSEVDFDTITHNNPYDANTKKFQILWACRQKSATLDCLKSALEENGCKEIAESLHQHLVEKGYIDQEGALIQQFQRLHVGNGSAAAALPQAAPISMSLPTHDHQPHGFGVMSPESMSSELPYGIQPTPSLHAAPAQPYDVYPPPPHSYQQLAPTYRNPLLGGLFKRGAIDSFRELKDFTVEEFRKLVQQLHMTDQDIGENKYCVWRFLEYWQDMDPRCTERRLVQVIEKKLNRQDVGDTLREFLPAGKAGPRLPENMRVRSMKFEHRQKISTILSVESPDGLHDWRMVASRLGIDNMTIQYYRQQQRSPPMTEVFSYWEVKDDSTVGYLYDLLVELEMPVIADML